MNPLNLQIEIATNDNMLVFDLMNAKESHVGMTNAISSNITLRLDRQRLFESIGTPDIINLTLSIGKDIAVGVFSAWLYDKLKDRARNLKINGTAVGIDKSEINRTIEAKITSTARIRQEENKPPTS